MAHKRDILHPIEARVNALLAHIGDRIDTPIASFARRFTDHADHAVLIASQLADDVETTLSLDLCELLDSAFNSAFDALRAAGAARPQRVVLADILFARTAVGYLLSGANVDLRFTLLPATAAEIISYLETSQQQAHDYLKECGFDARASQRHRLLRAITDGRIENELMSRLQGYTETLSVTRHLVYLLARILEHPNFTAPAAFIDRNREHIDRLFADETERCRRVLDSVRGEALGINNEIDAANLSLARIVSACDDTSVLIHVTRSPALQRFERRAAARRSPDDILDQPLVALETTIDLPRKRRVPFVVGPNAVVLLSMLMERESTPEGLFEGMNRFSRFWVRLGGEMSNLERTLGLRRDVGVREARRSVERIGRLLDEAEFSDSFVLFRRYLSMFGDDAVELQTRGGALGRLEGEIIDWKQQRKQIAEEILQARALDQFRTIELLIRRLREIAQLGPKFPATVAKGDRDRPMFVAAGFEERCSRIDGTGFQVLCMPGGASSLDEEPVSGVEVFFAEDRSTVDQLNVFWRGSQSLDVVIAGLAAIGSESRHEASGGGESPLLLGWFDGAAPRATRLTSSAEQEWGNAMREIAGPGLQALQLVVDDVIITAEVRVADRPAFISVRAKPDVMAWVYSLVERTEAKLPAEYVSDMVEYALQAATTQAMTDEQ